MDGSRSSIIVFGVWMLLMLANTIFMLTSRNVALKRRVALVGSVLIAILMMGFIVLFIRQVGIALLLLPILALAVAISARRLRFCDACGMTNVLANPFKSEVFCSGCGKPLDTKRRWF